MKRLIGEGGFIGLNKRAIHIKVFDLNGTVVSDKFQSYNYNVRVDVDEMKFRQSQLLWFKDSSMFPECIRSYLDDDDYEYQELVFIRCPPTNKVENKLVERTYDFLNITKGNGYEVQIQVMW